METNLVGGRRKDIFILSQWELDMPFEQSAPVIGSGIQRSYYKIPPEAREGKNIVTVIGVEADQYSGIPGSSAMRGGGMAYGVTAQSELMAMLNSHTNAQSIIYPKLSLQGNNIICIQPKQIIEGMAISVMLEYDSYFINMNVSGKKALADFALCCTKQYIATELRVKVDETQVVAGMEIGVIRDIVNEYVQASENYAELLNRLKGSMHADTTTLSKLIAFAM